MTTIGLSWKDRLLKSKWTVRIFISTLMIACVLKDGLFAHYRVRVALSPSSASFSTFRAKTRSLQDPAIDPSSLLSMKMLSQMHAAESRTRPPGVEMNETLLNSTSATLSEPVPLIVSSSVLLRENSTSVVAGDTPRNTSSTSLEIGIQISEITARLSTDDTCVTPELVGKWDFHGKAMHAMHTAPFCCDIESTYPTGHEYCEPNASGEFRYEFHGQEQHLSSMGGRGCGMQCQRHFEDLYRWNSTNLPNWNATEFCTHLGDRRIIMIGDSTMSQAATTLMNAAHDQCQTQMSFFLSDTLLNQEYGNLNRGEHWLDLVGNHSKRNDDIVVLTVGGHILKKRDLTHVSDAIVQQIVELRKTRPGLQVVYKSQQPGGCSPQIANVSLTSSEAARSFSWKRKLYNFNYPFLYDYDERSIRQLQAHNIPFLDMRMLYSRSDAHPYSRGRGRVTDCLHFCSPGPLDVFPSLFLRLLKHNFAVPQCI